MSLTRRRAVVEKNGDAPHPVLAVTRQVEELDHFATGAAFRAERERLGFSMEKIAGMMELTVAYISQLERGRANWSGDLIDQYNNALRGIPLNQTVKLKFVKVPAK